MNEKVTTSYTIAHTVSGTVLVERNPQGQLDSNAVIPSIGGLEVRTPRHLLLLDATLPTIYDTDYRYYGEAAPDFFKIIHQGVEHTLRLGNRCHPTLCPIAHPWIKQNYVYSYVLGQNRIQLYTVYRRYRYDGG